MWSGWMMVPMLLSALAALLFWILIVVLVITAIEDHRHRPHPRHRFW